MKKYKKITSVAIASAMLVGATVGFAAPRDVYNSDGTLHKVAEDMAVSPKERANVMVKPGSYLFEGNNGKLYSFADANEAYNKDSDNFLEILEKEYDEEGNVSEADLKVESVSAITKRVFSGERAQLEFAVNGEEDAAVLKDVEDAGYKVEFLATVGVSANGKLTNVAKDAFEYKVVIKDEDGEVVAESELQKVEVVSDSKIKEITEYKVKANGVELASKTISTKDSNIKIDGIKGTNLKGDKDNEIDNAKFKSLDENIALIDAKGNIIPLKAGNVDIEVEAGDAKETVSFKVVTEERELTEVTSDKESIGTVTNAKPSIVLTVKDQFGDVMKDVELTAEDVKNSDDKDILKVGTISKTDEKGEIEVKLTATSVKGTGELVLKADDKVVLTLSVTVGDSSEVDHRKLEFKDANQKNTIDVNADNDDYKTTTELYYNQYAEGNLLIGPESNIATQGKTYTVESDKESVASVSVDMNGLITVTAEGKGDAKISVKEGTITRASIDIKVLNTSSPKANVDKISGIEIGSDNNVTVSEVALDGKITFDQEAKVSSIKIAGEVIKDRDVINKLILALGSNFEDFTNELTVKLTKAQVGKVKEFVEEFFENDEDEVVEVTLENEGGFSTTYEVRFAE